MTPKRWLPGPQGLVVLGAAVAAGRLGLRPISDNSTLVHIRTGIELVHHWTVPHHDPYSFTATGHPWVVQSWLASAVYGAANWAGHHALVLTQAALMAAVGAVMTLAGRSTTAWRTGVVAFLAISASAPGWSPRPLLFGLLCLAALTLVVEREANPWWLVPIAWVWVNSHGSFPLGVAWLGARALGSAIDQRAWPRSMVRYVGGFAAGLAVSVLNPVGPRLLLFPFVAIHKRSTFQAIVEWRSPNFQDPNSFVALVFIALSLVVLLRAALPWAQLLPVVGFLFAALVAERNLGPLGVALAPALGCAFSSFGPASPAFEWVSELGRSVAWRAAAAGVAVAVAVGMVVIGVHGRTMRLNHYPVAAVAHLAAVGRLGPDHRIATNDSVGCFLIWRAGPRTKVFIDDRYDMYPRAVTADSAVLAAGRADAVGVLDRWRVDTVMWAAGQALPGTLQHDPMWRVDFRDQSWVVLVRA